MKKMRYWLVAICAATMLLANGCGTDTKADAESKTESVVESTKDAESAESSDSAGDVDNAEATESTDKAENAGNDESVPQVEVESTFTVDIGEDMEGAF